MKWRPRLNLTLTPTGRFIAFLAVFVGFAASNTGNNLLFLIVAGLLALLIIVAGISYLNLIDLQLAWLGDAEGFAGDEASLILKITEVGQRPRFCICVANSRCLDLDQGESAELPLRLKLLQRGKFEISGLKLFSTFPMGLFRGELQLPPAVVWSFPHPRFATLSGPLEKAAAFRPDLLDRIGEFWMLVPYQEGQDARYINWPISARSEGEWVVVGAIPHGEPFRIWLDLTGIYGEAFEKFLEYVTGLILRSAAGHASLFVWYAPTNGKACWVLASDPSGRSNLLRWLAELTPGVSLPTPPEACSFENAPFSAVKINASTFPE